MCCGGVVCRPPLVGWCGCGLGTAQGREQCSSFRLKVCGVFKPLGLLVPVNSTPYGASISGLSTQWSSWGPYTPQGGGRSHLEEGFPLRCFQRLSRPNVANQPCHWHDNWHTRGSS